MKFLFSHFFSLFFAISALAQPADIFHFNLNSSTGSEKHPAFYPGPNGGFYLVYQVIKSNPDSTFCAVSYLNSSFESQWNRVFKLRASTGITGVLNEQDGGISFMINGNNTSSLYYPYLIKMSASGNIQQSTFLMDSSSINQNSGVYYLSQLANGSRILAGRSRLIRLNASGTVDFARTFRFQGLSTRGFSVSDIISVPGSNIWYAVGGIEGGGMAALMKFNDTIQVFSHLYNFNSPGSTSSIRSASLYPNGDLLVISTEGISWVTMARINAEGTVLWTKTHKMEYSVRRAILANDGDIWLVGAITAGQAGGFVAHFSPTGNFINHQAQFKLGFSHEPITSLLELPGNQLLATYKAYYNNTSVLMFNRINQNIDFVCYHYPFGTFTDTSLVTVDSATSQMKKVVVRFGASTNLPFPISVSSPELVKGPVTCATPVSDLQTDEKFKVYPNPFSGKLWIDGLDRREEIQIFTLEGKQIWKGHSEKEIDLHTFSLGIYRLEIPGIGFRKMVVKQ